MTSLSDKLKAYNELDLREQEMDTIPVLSWWWTETSGSWDSVQYYLIHGTSTNEYMHVTLSRKLKTYCNLTLRVQETKTSLILIPIRVSGESMNPKNHANLT